MGRAADDDYHFSENAIEWLSGERKATVTVSQKKWVDALKALAKAGKCKATVNRDGTVCAKIPTSWIKIEEGDKVGRNDGAVHGSTPDQQNNRPQAVPETRRSRVEIGRQPQKFVAHKSAEDGGVPGARRKERRRG